MLQLGRIFSAFFCLASLSGWSISTNRQPSTGSSLVTEKHAQNVFEHEPAKVPACQHVSTGLIDATECDYETVESITDELFKNLNDLVKTPFFRYFRVDLYRGCPFWREAGFCMNRECGISTVDESDIPERWRAASLSKVEMPSQDAIKLISGCYYRETDYCVKDDPAEGDYVDLVENPERFTGYAGESAHRVWSTIYNENCFGIRDYELLSEKDANGNSREGSRFSSLRQNRDVSSEQCLEKRIYYKIISGLHASISTHLCHEWFNQTSGEWTPNLECFVSRVAAHPERLEYIYFNTVLLMRAIAKLGPYLSTYDYCSSGTHKEDEYALEKLGKVIDIASRVGHFDESKLFSGEDANIVKEEFKTHFRNVTRIMDCVGCDKCRLWGKVQTLGIATALKTLFEMDDKMLNPKTNPNLLTRAEVVALINTFHRLTESLYFVEDFRAMWTSAALERSRSMTHEAATSSTQLRRSSPSQDTLVAHDRKTWEIRDRRETFKAVKGRLWDLIGACGRSTWDSLHTCVRLAQDIISSTFGTLWSDNTSTTHPEL